MSDPFVIKNHRDAAKRIIDDRKAAGDEATKEAKQRVAERAKPKFNELLVSYRPKWALQ